MDSAGTSAVSRSLTLLLAFALSSSISEGAQPGIGWGDSAIFTVDAYGAPHETTYGQPGIAWADSPTFGIDAYGAPHETTSGRPGIAWGDSASFGIDAYGAPHETTSGRPGIAWADASAFRIDASRMHSGWADSPLFSIDAAQGDWYVTASVAFHADADELTIAAFAYDRATGQERTTGVAAYRFVGVTSGALTYSAGRWRATVDVSPFSLSSGLHSVQVTVGTKNCLVTFTITDNSGSVSGRVTDTQGDPLASATVRIYESVDFYQPDRTPIGTSSTTAGGPFSFAGLEPGWYIVEAQATGYLTGRTTAFEMTQGSSVTQDVMLAQPGETLAKLLPQMETLRESVYQTMLDENEIMAALTARATDDLGNKPEDSQLIWKGVSVLGDILDPAGASLSFVTSQVAGEIGNAVVAATSALAPEVGLQPWSADALRGLDAWTGGEQMLSTSHAAFAGAADSTTVAPAFDFDKAVRMIRDQGKGIEEIRRGRVPMTIPLADPADEYIGISLPAGAQTYISAAAAMKQAGALKKVATGVQVVAGGAAVVLSVTGVGAGVAGAIYAGATVTKTVLGVAELVAKSMAGVTYVSSAKGWGTDVNSLPGVYMSAADLLTDEAANPMYLDTANTFSADASMVVSENIYTSLGRKILPISLPVSFRNATINVTNTGNVASSIRVRANGVWTHKVEEGFPFLSGLPWIGDWFGGSTTVRTPTSSSYTAQVLQPGASQTLSVPFTVFYMIGPTDLLSSHSLEVDVYSGPFICKTLRDFFYLNFESLSLLDESPGQTTIADVAPKAGYKKAGQVRAMEGDDFAAMLPLISTIIDGTVSTSSTLLSHTYTVGDQSWSVEFSLYGDPAATIALQVYDAAGLVVGNVPAKGGAVVEFVADYNGSGADPQIVDIPAATGQTYTVKAVLFASDSEGPFDVQVFASEVPIRPAVLAITPSGVSVTTRPGLDVTVPVSFGEAGHQQPLTDTVVSAADLAMAGGQNTLALFSASTSSFGTVKAGSSDFTEIVYEVPGDAAPGQYDGEVTVTTTSAGSQSMAVSILVLPKGDVNGDCVVNILDMLAVRNGLNADVSQGENEKLDVNRDGTINILDMIVVRNNLNMTCD